MLRVGLATRDLAMELRSKHRQAGRMLRVRAEGANGGETRRRPETVSLRPGRRLACRLRLAPSLLIGPPAGRSPEELIKVQIPGSLPQTCLISVFGTQAQEHGF